MSPETDARRIAEQERDRVRFEEEVLELAEQVYRVARRLVSSREEAEDLVQETYARAFRSWSSFTPGTNLRAWLLRILTNLNIDRGRREQRAPDTQPLEEGDYFLYNKLEETGAAEGTRVRLLDEILGLFAARDKSPSHPVHLLGQLQHLLLEANAIACLLCDATGISLGAHCP